MKLRNTTGLTLIEFLLAFAIFAIIALCIYGTFFSGLQISQRSNNFERFSRSIRWSLDTLQYDLENMVEYQVKNQSPSTSAFSGNDQGFFLILPTDTGLKKIHYLLRDPQDIQIHTVQIGQHTSKNVALQTGEISNQKRTSLLIRQEQAWGQKPQDEILNKQILKNSFKISYGSLEKDSWTWKNDWSETSFPAAIRLQATFLDPDDSKHIIPIQKTIIIPVALWGKNTDDKNIKK